MYTSAAYFFCFQQNLLVHLNNSVLVRISISYSILNMPKRSTEGPDSVWSFVTDNRATNSFCFTVLQTISFVPGSFSQVFVSVMLLTSVPASFPYLLLSLHCDQQVSTDCVCMFKCVCVHGCSVTWDQVTVEPRKEAAILQSRWDPAD